jgi:hypothetical protein
MKNNSFARPATTARCAPRSFRHRAILSKVDDGGSWQESSRH